MSRHPREAHSCDGGGSKSLPAKEETAETEHDSKPEGQRMLLLLLLLFPFLMQELVDRQDCSMGQYACREKYRKVL